MIYLVSNQQELFTDKSYKLLGVKESIQMMCNWKVIQFDTETNGRDCHVNKLLCAQFGNRKAGVQVVVDCSSVSLKEYKSLLESKTLLLQNAKFDLQFLYCQGIVPRKVYDTMLAEQILHLGTPSGQIVSPEEYIKYNYDFPYHEFVDKKGRTWYKYSVALNAISKKRLGKDIDKTIRGQIIYRGLDTEVIQYAAGDVIYLEDIADSQYKEAVAKGLVEAVKVECRAVPWVAYLEWCGCHCDEAKWSAKMEQDRKNLKEAEDKLNEYCIGLPKLKKFVKRDLQGDLFLGFNPDPIWTVDWQKKQAIDVFKILGFNTEVPNDKYDEDDEDSDPFKDSIQEKHLKSQKGIDDEFLKLYFNYQGYFKVCSSFGQGHLNAINPITGNIHTDYHQIGCTSGRMSCGSSSANTDLARYKKIPEKECKYPNMQQLPSDEVTRACFTSKPGYLWSSCDYSALESRLGADIYNEKAMLDEFLYGSGDMHSLCAYMVFDTIPRDTPIKDIKAKYPHERKDVKPIEFSQQFPTLSRLAKEEFLE